MSFAFMPVYTGDYLRDTRHLTPQKHGIYFLLLMHCWDQKGPVPLDEQEAGGIANCRSADEIESLRYILARFFVKMEDGYYSPRMQKEVERANAISLARSSAGAKGYQARAKQLPSKSQALVSTPTPTLTTTPTTTTTTKNIGSRFALTQLPDDWLLFCRKERPDLDPTATFASFADYWISVPGQKGRKASWEATWRNWVRNQRKGTGNGRSAAEQLMEELNAVE